MVGYYLPKLVGLCGRKGSGKDTAGHALAESYGYKIIKFADPLKNMLRSLLTVQNCPFELRERMIEGDLKEVPSGYLGGQTPRYAMQTLGTEWGRDLIHKDFWIHCFINQIKLDDNSRYVCTDMRFDNEVELVKQLGGLTLRIQRETNRNSFSDHPSETAIDNLKVFRGILNSGTIEDLQNELKMLVINDANMTKLYDASTPMIKYVTVI